MDDAAQEATHVAVLRGAEVEADFLLPLYFTSDVQVIHFKNGIL